MAKPLASDPAESEAMTVKASTMRPKYSGGPNLSAWSARNGAKKVSPPPPSVPAKKEPMDGHGEALGERPGRERGDDREGEHHEAEVLGWPEPERLVREKRREEGEPPPAERARQEGADGRPWRSPWRATRPRARR